MIRALAKVHVSEGIAGQPINQSCQDLEMRSSRRQSAEERGRCSWTASTTRLEQGREQSFAKFTCARPDLSV